MFQLNLSEKNNYPNMKEVYQADNAVWNPISYPLSLKKKIVMHITQGSTAAGTIEYFKTIVYRAHFVIDRDPAATVYQLAPISEFINHASAVNGISIGIEHVAIAPGTLPSLPAGLLPTEAQYQASAALVRWLGGKLGIPVDRQHVQGHFTASPGDHHVQCCEPTLNLDRIIQLANMPAPK